MAAGRDVIDLYSTGLLASCKQDAGFGRDIIKRAYTAGVAARATTMIGGGKGTRRSRELRYARREVVE